MGVALGLDRLLLAQYTRSDEPVQPGPIPAEMVVITGNDAAAMQVVEEWRAQGQRIIVDVSEDAPADVWQRACAGGIGRLLVRQGDGFDIYDDPEKDGPSDRLMIAQEFRDRQSNRG